MNDQLPSSYRTHFLLRRRRAKYTLIAALAGLVVVCLGCILAYNLPPIHSRLAWRVEAVWAKIRPHKEEIFIPQEQAKSQATLQAAIDSRPAHRSPRLPSPPPPRPSLPWRLEWLPLPLPWEWVALPLTASSPIPNSYHSAIYSHALSFTRTACGDGHRREIRGSAQPV